MSNHRRDPLTGLRTRAYALAMLEDLVNHASGGEHIGVIWIDVDHFKELNECMGHLKGDETLVALADMMRSVASRDVVAARLHSDHFLIVAPNSGIAQTLKLAEAIRASVVNIEVGNGVIIALTLGVSCFPDDGVDAKELIDAADVSCYMGKKRGGSRVISARDTLRRGAPPQHEKS